MLKDAFYHLNKYLKSSQCLHSKGLQTSSVSIIRELCSTHEAFYYNSETSTLEYHEENVYCVSSTVLNFIEIQ